MTFFEQVGKRITDAGQVAAQHTRVLTDTTRLNVKIAENKKKMTQLLFEMGQDYYQKHRKETDNEEQEYIDQVNVLFREIIQWQDEIERLKSADVCRVCGSRIMEGASFCMGCGTRLGSDEIEEPPVIPAAGTKTCPICGSVIEEDSVYCTACGVKLEDLNTPQEPYEFMELEEVHKEAPREIGICPVCGLKAMPGDTFCQNCGTKL